MLQSCGGFTKSGHACARHGQALVRFATKFGQIMQKLLANGASGALLTDNETRRDTTSSHHRRQVSIKTRSAPHPPCEPCRSAHGVLRTGRDQFAHLLNDMIQSLIFAIYPMFKSEFSLSFGQIGLITLTYQITASLLQPLVGCGSSIFHPESSRVARMASGHRADATGLHSRCSRSAAMRAVPSSPCWPGWS